MKLDLYQIDTFTNTVFGGNPACIVPLDKWISDVLLLKIARENAVAKLPFMLTREIKYIYVGLLQK
jgi:predicted PhzF superfamily epimerase YddE/YHI9